MKNIGFGTALKGNDRNNFDIMYKVLHNYFINNNGYYLDTAERYFNTEIVGKSLKSLNLNRNSIYIIGKIYPITDFHLYKNNVCFPKNKNQFIERVHKMLLNLGIEYFDVLNIHGKNWDNYDKNISDTDSINTFKTMIELKQKGIIKNLGVSNYTINDIENIYNKLKIYPDSVQIYLSLYNFDLTYINYCRKRNIKIFCYGSLSGNKYLENKNLKINYDIIQAILNKYNCNEKELIVSLMKSLNISPIISSSNIYKKINDEINIDRYDIYVIHSLHKPINISKYNLEKKTDNCYYITSILRPDVYEIMKSSHHKIWNIKGIANQLEYNYDILKILKKNNFGDCNDNEINTYLSFFNYLNSDDFLNDTIKNIFGEYLKNNDEFLLDFEKIKMNSDNYDKLNIEQLQKYSREYYKNFKSNKINKNDLYTVVNYQNRTGSGGKPPHKDHEYRIFSLILYFCTNNVPTQLYDGPSLNNKGKIIHQLYPKENCATIFLNDKHSIHAAAPNIKNIDRKTIYLSIISNLLSWKYVHGINQ